MFFIGMLTMAYNTYKTIRGSRSIAKAS
jgi:cbb3-type cytochrome oxidase subunit 1